MKFLIIMVSLFSYYSIFGSEEVMNEGWELLSPMDHSIYHEEMASVVVTFKSPSIEKIVITTDANQTVEVAREKGRDTYCKTVPLIAGENRVRIKGYGKNGWSKEYSIILYHDSVLEKRYKHPPESYVIKDFHLSSNEKKCTPCHTMEVNEISGIAFKNPEESNCYSCHKKLTARGEGHAPAINWLCTSCHQKQNGSGEKDNDANGPKFKLPRHIGEACLKCHTKAKERWEAKRFHHMPVDAAKCTRCHNPHSSVNRFYLIAKPWELCTSCHTDKREGNHFINTFGNKIHPTHGKPDPSRPGHELECISCHNPHASDSSALLEGGNGITICLKCHKK
ncbi:MAG: hypothetical protein M0P91_08285 [Sulfuricurvum sp.]|jgi:predicted CXXCH cytochrome family protein|uniref:cytochrome c3 family protein n=1 Tax=Sulfuricurvum sp. TaxID=2025608 RepID=UPI0025F8A78C|nr:cytochrome c3 family protein [Sulfuricurvum sp.]MCK9373182.1 hypothetical protein [Sulfuricurvum sp.]